MHAWCDQHFVYEPFKTDWESQVTVVKEHFQLKGQLVNGKGPGRNADKTYLDHAKEARKCDLAKVKSKGRRDVQFRIGMVNVMKAPKKRRAVVGEMPVVKGQIHQQKTDNELEPAWEGKEMDKTEWLVSGPTQRPLGGWLDQSNSCKEREGRNGQIDQKAAKK